MSEAIRTSVEAFLQQNGIAYAVRYVGETVKTDTDPKGWKCDEWRVTLSKGAGKIECPYYTGLGHRKIPALQKARVLKEYHHSRHAEFAKPVAPHAADVLHSLTLDGQAADMSFHDWCADYGYDSDSIKALGIYNECCKTGRELRAMFGRDGLQTLSEMLQDY